MAMAKSVSVDVRVADVPQMKQFIGATAGLLRALARCEGLPDPVMAAADQVRLAVVALGDGDIGPPPGVSDEELIRRAMDEAKGHPGRVVTVDGG